MRKGGAFGLVGFHFPARRLGVIALVSAFAAGIVGCRAKPDPVPDVAVDPSLEMVPPIAREVAIKQLAKNPNGNLLVVADFGESRLKSPFHAIELSTGKVVLRDDGKGGDEQAGDRKYSVALTEDIASLTAEMEDVQKRLPEMMRRPAFKGRQMIRPVTQEVMAFSLDEFKKGAVIKLPDWFCLLLHDVSIEHSLMVTAVSVVEDATRINNPCPAPAATLSAWSFGKLMTDIANTPATGVSAEDFVKSWLNTWLNTTSVNSDSVPERDALFAKVIQPRSGSPAGSFDINTWMAKPLDLKGAPFKLTAIVNRLDLRGNSGYGFANPGEGRFVFETLNLNVPAGSPCPPLGPGGFTVIFEYGLPVHRCKDLKDYAKKWYDLKTLALGSSAYNTALQDVTDVFAKAGADPSKPNGSALNQIRTNEIALAGPWELREFNVDAATHLLFLTTVKQEPAKKYNAKANPAGAAADVTLMASWVNANATDVENDRHSVPLSLPTGEPFLGGKAHTEFGGFWDAAPMEITSDEARHHFSLNTCSGCHGGETQTVFLHVGTPPFGTPAPLSGFLTGITVTDPAGRPTGSPASRTFGDLERRRRSLQELLCTRCGGKKLPELVELLRFKPIHMTH